MIEHGKNQTGSWGQSSFAALAYIFVITPWRVSPVCSYRTLSSMSVSLADFVSAKYVPVLICDADLCIQPCCLERSGPCSVGQSAEMFELRD